MMNKIRVRAFTESGSDAFRNLIQIKPQNIRQEIQKLVKDPLVSKETGADLELKSPKNRFDLAKNLWEVFGPDGLLYSRRRELGLWNWISAAYFGTLMDSDPRPDLIKKIGGVDRWVLGGDVLRDHRHLVSGPFFAYEANSEAPRRAMCQLATTVTQPGELVERISGKRNLASGPVCHLATLMYYDSSKESLRVGLTTPPGNPKRFSYYFAQLDRTIDYESMKVEELIEMLPHNFQKWKVFAREELKKTQQ
jgi:hypothetical protein